MPTILVADDEPDFEMLVRQRFRRRIRSGELNFLFAANGEHALQTLVENPAIDVLLTDINMPRMDGLALLNELADIRPDIKAVVVSAYGDMDNIRSAMNSGAFDFVTKPIDFQDLEITLNKTIEHVALLRDAEKQEMELTSIRRELEVARQLQQSILPRQFPKDDRYEVHAEMHPARAVGGDFYDVFHLPDARIGLVVGDIAGKGVPAALFMAIARTMLKATALSGCTPGECLHRVNDQIADQEPANMLVTLFYAVYDPASGDLEFANAGHDLPIIRRRGGGIDRLDNPDGVIAGVQSGLPYETRSASLAAGDRLIIYTDGAIDARDDAGERFETSRLIRLLSEQADGSSAADVVSSAMQSLNHHIGGADPADDITCLALCRTA